MLNFIVDFINTAFPWVVGGIAIAIIMTYGNRKKKEIQGKLVQTTSNNKKL